MSATDVEDSFYVTWQSQTYGYLHSHEDGRQVGFIYANEGAFEIEWLP